MSNGADSHSHVAAIHQRPDNTIELHVEVVNFAPGQEVEVSGYLTQGSGAYHAFHDKKYIPLDPTQRVLNVQLPAIKLVADEDVTVVTYVAEVWPTILGQDKTSEYVGSGLKAAWAAKDTWGKGPGDATSPAQGNTSPAQGNGGGDTSQQQ